MSLPLTGIRVVDFSRMFAGPCAAEVLADLGAEVIKIEDTRIGDPTRRNLPFWGDESAYFMSLNRGKRSVALDLKSELGKGVALKLIAAGDVVIENFRPGVMGRLGLDYERASAINPHIVFCSLSGFGATGPMRDKISFDLVNQAMAGMVDITGDPNDRPVRIGVPVGDMAGGLFLAASALAGLRNRTETGAGSHFELSLHDVLIRLLGEIAQESFEDSSTVTRMGHTGRYGAPEGCFAGSDGAWFVLSAPDNASWAQLRSALGNPKTLADQIFDSPSSRRANKEALMNRLALVLHEHPAAESVNLLTSRGISAALVKTLNEALESPEVTKSGIVFEADHPTVGTVKNLASPLVINGTRAGLGGVSPLLGADTESVLRGLGYDDQAISELELSKTVRTRR